MKKLFIFLFSIAMFVGCSNSNEPSPTTDVFPYKNGEIIKKLIYVNKSVDYDGNIYQKSDTSYNVYVRIKDKKLEFIDIDNNYILMTYYDFIVDNDLLNINLPENNLSIPNVTHTYQLSYNSTMYEGNSYYFQFKWDAKYGFTEIIDEFYYNSNKNISYTKNHYYFYY